MERKKTAGYCGNSDGSVLIITILITSIIFGVGITFSSILEKEIARQVYEDRSQKAANIANTALECALFNDFRRFTFDSSLGGGSSIVCGDLYQVKDTANWGTEYDLSSDRGHAGTGMYEFAIIKYRTDDLTNVSDVPCAHVIVQKRCVGGLTGSTCDSGVIDASIEVWGYDRCSSGNESDRDIVRRFKVHY